MIHIELREPELASRYYIALTSLGNMIKIGDCGDFDSAEEIAADLEIEVAWLTTLDEWNKMIRQVSS